MALGEDPVADGLVEHRRARSVEEILGVAAREARQLQLRQPGKALVPFGLADREEDRHRRVLQAT